MRGGSANLTGSILKNFQVYVHKNKETQKRTTSTSSPPVRYALFFAPVK